MDIERIGQAIDVLFGFIAEGLPNLIGRLTHAGNGFGAQPDGYYAICHEAATRLTELSARVAQLEAIAAKLAGALELIRDTGPAILTIATAREIAAQALTEYKDATDGKPAAERPNHD